MPKKKKLYVDVPKLLLYETIDHLLFAYIMGVQEIAPTASLQKSVELFMERFNLNEDNYPLDQAKQTWYRMLESYREFRKT